MYIGSTLSCINFQLLSKYWILLESGSYATLHFISFLHELFTKSKAQLQLNIITLGFLCITKTKSMSNHMDVMFTSSSSYCIVGEIALVSLISCSIWTFSFFDKKSSVPINVRTVVHIKNMINHTNITSDDVMMFVQCWHKVLHIEN